MDGCIIIITAHEVPVLWLVFHYILPPTNTIEPLISPHGVRLTACVPRMKVSRQRHMGNSTKLQLRFSTDADALLIHSPIWEKQKKNTARYRTGAQSGGCKRLKDTLKSRSRSLLFGFENKANWELEAWLHHRCFMRATFVPPQFEEIRAILHRGVTQQRFSRRACLSCVRMMTHKNVL